MWQSVLLWVMEELDTTSVFMSYWQIYLHICKAHCAAIEGTKGLGQWIRVSKC